jgi:hypothetical protein
MKKLDMVAHTCHPSEQGKHKIGRLWSRLAWAKRETPISKITRVKRAGRVAQMVGCLSSNPSPAKKKKANMPVCAKEI